MFCSNKKREEKRILPKGVGEICTEKMMSEFDE